MTYRKHKLKVEIREEPHLSKPQTDLGNLSSQISLASKPTKAQLAVTTKKKDL